MRLHGQMMNLIMPKMEKVVLDLASQTAVMAKIPTEHSSKIFWVNAARSPSDQK